MNSRALSQIWLVRILHDQKKGPHTAKNKNEQKFGLESPSSQVLHTDTFGRKIRCDLVDMLAFCCYAIFSLHIAIGKGVHFSV